MTDNSEKKAAGGKKIAIAAGVVALAIGGGFLAGKSSSPDPAPAAFAPQAAAYAPPAQPQVPAIAPQEPPQSGLPATGPRGPTKQEVAKGLKTYALAMVETVAFGLQFAPDPNVARKAIGSPKIAQGLLMLEAGHRGCEEADTACKDQARAAAKALHDSILASPNPALALQEALKPYKADTYMTLK